MTALIVLAALFIAAKYGWPLGVGCGVVAWLTHSYLFPITPCWACRGRTKHSSETGKSWNIWCWGSLLGMGCGGSGSRRRLGSKLVRGGFGRL